MYDRCLSNHLDPTISNKRHHHHTESSLFSIILDATRRSCTSLYIVVRVPSLSRVILGFHNDPTLVSIQLETRIAQALNLFI
jgi:hypothetical protein